MRCQSVMIIDTDDSILYVVMVCVYGKRYICMAQRKYNTAVKLDLYLIPRKRAFVPAHLGVHALYLDINLISICKTFKYPAFFIKRTDYIRF